MDLKMLVIKLGIIVMLNMQSVFLAKDSFEFSQFTFAWEDAESRCTRQDQILVPGRSYRAKLIKKLMTKNNVESVWMNGWRAVSDTTPESDGKLRTLKIDFSRSQNKEHKMVCQIDSIFYDPLYTAQSTNISRGICERDGGRLADVATQNDLRGIADKIIVDKPHWINSISSRGRSGYYISSKIKQCLVARLEGDDLKYTYDDCSMEYNFICVKGDDIISSFSPLISLKLARFEEFEEVIEKYEQSMPTSYDLFSSMDIDLEVSSTVVPLISSSTVSQKTTSIEIKPSKTTVAGTSLTSLSSPETSTIKTEPQIFPSPTSTAFEKLSYSELFSDSYKPLLTDSADVQDPTISSTVLVETDQAKATREAVEVESISSSADKGVPMISTLVKYDVIEKSLSFPSNVIESSAVEVNIPVISSSTSYIAAEQSLSSMSQIIESLKASESLQTIGTSQVSGSLQAIQSSLIVESSIDELFQKSANFDKLDSDSSYNTLSASNGMIFPSDTLASRPSSVMKMSAVEETTLNVITTSYITGTEESISTTPILLQPTKAFSTSSSSLTTLKSELNEMDELVDDTFASSYEMEDDTMTISISSSEIQSSVVSGTPSLTQQFMPSSISPSEGDMTPYIATHISKDSDVVVKPISTSALPHIDIDLPSIVSELVTSPSKDVSTEPASTSTTAEMIIPHKTTAYDLPEDSKLAMDSFSQSTIEPSTNSNDCIPKDATLICPDTFSDTADTFVLDSTVSKYKTLPMTKSMTKSLVMSSVPMSSSSMQSVSSSFDDMDTNTDGFKPLVTSLVTDIETSSIYDDTREEYHDKYDYVDINEDIMPTLSVEVFEATSRYTIDTSDPFLDNVNDTDNVDQEIHGDIDKGDKDEDDNVGNVSADTGKTVEKKNGEEKGGIEVGLWVAFAILIALVLIALILAAYLYRRRKLQKSKDISAPPPAAGAGETVELRDSRSPSRENGKPRESATFKDPAYDI